MRKRWILVSLMVGALALVLTGGAVLAQRDDSDSDSRMGKFAERVASILGLETSQVHDAMEQAKTELRQEVSRRSWTAWWRRGEITQEQADEFKTWVEAKPDGAFMGFHHWKIDAEDLDTLVKSGKITQEQANSYTEYAGVAGVPARGNTR